MRRLLLVAFSGVLTMFAGGGVAQDMSQLSGRALMEMVYARHRAFPYVYEEQSMILIDRHGRRETRRARRYSRRENGREQFLLLFDAPADVRGVALRSTREADGTIRNAVYLPAFGEQLVESLVAEGDGGLLGTDFSIENIRGEALDDYQHVRMRDMEIDHVTHYVVDSFHLGDDPANSVPARRHFILQDNLYIVRTDHYDRLGRLVKRQRHHDLQPVDGAMWRANIVLMDNLARGTRTVLKIDRRVFSADYVPAEVFTPAWLFANAPHPLPPAETALLIGPDGQLVAAEAPESSP